MKQLVRARGNELVVHVFVKLMFLQQGHLDQGDVVVVMLLIAQLLLLLGLLIVLVLVYGTRVRSYCCTNCSIIL